jgi:tetratricopeptide (TPR) repeat protein
MGVVYLAEQEQPVRRKVALKIIKPGLDSAQVIARFEAERQALALMDHPNIAKVLDAGTTESGRPYFVMELVHGVPFTRYCDENRLTPRERLALFVPVCQAVQHAHQKGIIHRDLKPSNVLVAPYDGRPVVKVIDFGVAKAAGQKLTERTLFTEFGAVLGTLEYMSPEQAELNNQDIDTRSDVYSLGVLLYELLTGTTPLTKARMKQAAFTELLRLIREEEPPRPSARLSESREALPSISAQRQTEPAQLTRLVKGELDWIVMKALEKDRGRRYETANGLARDLQRYLADEPVEACPPSAGYRLRKLLHRHRTGVLAVAAFAALLLAGVVVSTWQAVRATRAEARAWEAADAERDAREAEASQRRRAEEAEALARDRLAEVTREKQRADGEARTAQAVNEFLQQDLLLQADSLEQADRGFPAEPNLTVREALNRAAAKIGDRFRDQPLVEAAVRQAIGDAYRGVGAPRLGVPHLVRAQALREAQLGRNHPDTLNSAHNLALLYLEGGQFDRAVTLFEAALAKMKEKLGPDHADTLQTMHNLAIAYLEAGSLDRALPLYEESLRRRTEKLGADHPSVLESLNGLGLAYKAAGQYDRAVQLLHKAHAQARERLGPDHPHTLRSVNSLGLAYLTAGRTDEAVRLFEQNLAKAADALGPDHPHTLMSKNNLALAYRDAGRLDKAVPLFEQTLAQTKEKLGPDHPRTLLCMSNLGLAYQAAGQLSKAAALFADTLARQQEILGPEHPDTVAGMNNLALAYQYGGQPEKAVPLFQQALAKMKEKLGPDHPGTLLCTNNLGWAYLSSGQPDRAVPLLQEALARQKEKLGPDHPDTLLSSGNLGQAYVALKQPDAALPLFRALLEGQKRRLGPDSPRLAALQAVVSLDLLKAGRPVEAEPIVRECLAIREKSEPDAWTTYNTRSLLGGSLLGQKQYAEAEPLLRQGYEGMKQREAQIPPQFRQVRLSEALERLVQLYDGLGKQDEADRWRQRLEEAKKGEKSPNQ